MNYRKLLTQMSITEWRGAAAVFSISALITAHPALAFEVVPDPELPQCLVYQNNGQYVLFAGSQERVAVDQSCWKKYDPRFANYPGPYYTVQPLTSTTMDKRGKTNCTGFLQPDGQTLVLKYCGPNRHTATSPIRRSADRHERSVVIPAVGG